VIPYGKRQPVVLLWGLPLRTYRSFNLFDLCVVVASTPGVYSCVLPSPKLLMFLVGLLGLQIASNESLTWNDLLPSLRSPELTLRLLYWQFQQQIASGSVVLWTIDRRLCNCFCDSVVDYKWPNLLTYLLSSVFNALLMPRLTKCIDSWLTRYFARS